MSEYYSYWRKYLLDMCLTYWWGGIAGKKHYQRALAELRMMRNWARS